MEHTLLVSEDYLRSLDLKQPLQTVVADDDATIELVEVGRGETTAIERHERAQVGRNYRDDLENHPLRLVTALGGAKPLNDLKTLEGLVLALLRRLVAGLVAQVVGELVKVNLLKEHLESLGAHLGDELIGVVIVEELVLLRQRVDDGEILLLREEIKLLDTVLRLDARVYDNVALVIYDGIHLLGRDAKEAANLVGEGPEIPDVGDRHNERDVTHTLAAHLFLGHLDAAAVAYDAFVADALVLSAMALVVLDGAEDALAKEAIALRLIRPVVDGLGL